MSKKTKLWTVLLALGLLGVSCFFVPGLSLLKISSFSHLSNHPFYPTSLVHSFEEANVYLKLNASFLLLFFLYLFIQPSVRSASSFPDLSTSNVTSPYLRYFPAVAINAPPTLS